MSRRRFAFRVTEPRSRRILCAVTLTTGRGGWCVCEREVRHRGPSPKKSNVNTVNAVMESISKGRREFGRDAGLMQNTYTREAPGTPLARKSRIPI